MKNTMKKILGVSVLALTFTLALPAWAAIPAPSVDPSSAYTPTKIVNGDFATFPWTDFTYGGVRHTTGFFQSVNNVTVHPNGVDGGWNTTETSVWNATGSLYDNFYDADPSTGSGYPKRSDGTRTLGYVNAHSGSASCGSASLYGKGQNIFIEMNASHADTLYQDLTTYGNDVIRWTLKHAARTDADTYQPITVLIGAPQMSGSSIVYPSGTDAKIVASTLGSYNYAGCSGAYAYANVSELANLRLNKSTQSGAWYTASGVYMIPEGQSVTRFAFRSDATTANAGNFLDDLTFSTLIGNLSAKANGDGSVTVTGYWGDADAAKKLCVKIGETVHQLDMAGVLNQNFTVTIPAATIGSVAQIEVYHQDYESARRTVKIYDHWHCICGDGACTAAGHAHQVVGWDKWTSTTTLPTTAGNWYLANDVTLSATYTAVNGVNLCLNGHVVKGNNFTMPGYGSYKSVIRVPGSVAFTLTDCGTTVRYFTDKNGDRCYETYATVKPSGTEGTDYLTIIGGVLTGGKGSNTSHNYNSKDGGGVYVEDNGRFTMYNGNIVGNLVDNQGAGVCVCRQNAKFVMNGGTIQGNSQDKWFGAGVYVYSSGNTSSMEMNGGVIAYNTKTATGWGSGGGIYAEGPLSIVNGSIHHNSLGGGSLPGVRAGSLTIGGKTVIVGNCTTVKNVLLENGQTITISSTTPLTAGAQIGVTTATVPTGTTKVPVTGANTADYSGYFTSDNPAYFVLNDANTVKLAVAPTFNVTFDAACSDAKRDGAAFASTNAVITYGSAVGVPVLTREDLVFVGWSKTAGSPTAEYKTAEEVSTMTTEAGSSHTLYAVWGAEVRIPVFVALDGLGVVPQDGRTYAFSITNGSVTTPLQPCCTNLVLACPAGTGDVYRVGFATNDVTNPWTLSLGEGTYIYDIRQKTVARPGEQLAEGTWRTCIKVDFSEKPYVTLTNNEYLDAIDDLSEGAFKAVKSEGAASFSSVDRYIVLGSDTQTVVSYSAFNRALVKSKFAFDFTRSFRVDGTMQVGNAADGTAIGFVPNGQDLDKDADFSDEGSALGCYKCSKNGNGLFLEFDTLNDGGGWGGETDYLDYGAHFVLTTTSASGYPSNVKGQHVTFGANYNLPSEVMNYSIDYDSFSKEMLFTIKTTTQTWKLAYTNPPAVFGSTKAYMTLSGAMRFGPSNEWVKYIPVGQPAPKTKITIATFNYVNDAMTGAVENTFRNRQEALVTYNAWGGEIVPGVETTQAFANGGRYACPVDPERKGYEFLGWYAGWTNGAVQAVHGMKMDPIADCTVYARWFSKAIEPGKGEQTLDFEPAQTNAAGEAVGDGVVLKGATNALENTDFAIPELTSNGEDGKPYVIVKADSFAYANYDAKREDAGEAAKRLTSVTISTYVTNIQSYAFQDCRALTNVTFSATRDYLTGAKTKLVVGDWAFKGSAVTSITFPADSCVELDYGAFANADNLRDIYILGDVSVKSCYPFLGAGKAYVKATGTPVNVHLSAKLAADAAFVAALTNGMSAARVVLSQKIEGGDQGATGSVTITSGPSVGGDQVTFAFKVESDSPWVKVTPETVYLFWSTTPDPKTFIGNAPKKPTALTGPVDGVWTATFEKPAAAGGTSAFFQLCIGDAE